MNPFLLLAQEFTKRFGEDIGKSADAIASGDIKKIAGTAYDTFAPIPVQAALYSPEAEAAFIGPQGIARLKAAGLGDKMKEFTSRFFGQRAEINPTDTDLVIQAMMGGPHAIAKAKQMEFESWNTAQKELLKQAKAYPESKGLQEALARHKAARPKQAVAADFLEHFPELVIAYPRLKELPINFFDNSIGVRYAGKYDPDFAKSVKVPYGVGLDAENAFYKAMGTQRFGAPAELARRGDKVSRMAKKRANIKAREDSYTGSIDVVGQANADIPGVQSYETILHEIQRFIQREEAGLGKVRGTHFLDLYADKEGKRLTNYDRLVDKLSERKDVIRKKYNKEHKLADAKIEAAEKIISEKQAAGKLTGDQASNLLTTVINQANKQESRAYSNYTYAINKYQNDNLPMHKKNWDYNMNPFEREAYESARRDTDPAYRKAYSRKTEVIK